MNIKKLIFTLLIGIVISSTIYGQSAKLKKANQHMEALDYQAAIQLFNEVLEKSDEPQAKINIAECYRKVNDPGNAEYWYGQVVRLPQVEPIHKLFYGQMLQRNGKCDLAKEWFEKYVIDVPGDMRGQYLLKACDYEDELRTKNAGIFDVAHMEFNSNLDDFSPAFFKHGIVFASERDRGTAVKRVHGWTGNPFLELYFIEAKQIKGEECGNVMYGRPEKFSDELNSKYHETAVTFSDDQKKIFFTRNNYEDNKAGKSDDGFIKLKVYSADIKKSTDYKGLNGWGNLKGLPFNSDEYSVAHPALTPDGKRLFFSSDMPGGFGGMDIYVSDKEGGRWGPPINLGPSINTEGNEIFPYFHKSGKLYFASDGLIGLGGLDIYFIEDKGNGEWTEVENLGYPINTIADDFSIIFNDEGTCGYFASDRDGGVGRDDIYSFRKTASPVQILVFDKETREPIEGASVVIDCTGNTMTTGADGTISIDMKMNQCCNFSASMESYIDSAQEGCTKGKKIGEPVFVEIALEKELTFALQGAVFDVITKFPVEGVSLTITNDTDDEIQTVVTNDDGLFSFEIKKETCYTIKGEKDNFITSQITNQCTRGLMESTTLQVNLDLQPYKVDVATVSKQILDGVTEISPSGIDDNGNVPYLVHVYYDFNQSYIREESIPALEALMKMLDLNPDFIVELGSHTDSRGSFRYNRRLSQRRAESVVRWLTNKGISRDRLSAVGYGENKNVNNCKNNVPCSEKEHQMNRRTEFRIIGKKGDIDIIQNSHPNPNARVSVCAGCPF
jgi:outer membrane protein OmpA-like peptidoglycan-associated protein